MGTTYSFTQLTEGKDKKLFPLYFLEGEDLFLIKEAAHHIVSKILEPEARDLNYSRMSGEKTLKAAAVISLCLQLPLLAKARIVYLEDINKMASEERDRLAGFIKEGLHKTILILSSSTSPLQKAKSPLGKKLESLVTDKGAHVSCQMTDRDLEEWCINSMNRLGYEIRQDAAHLLRMRTGANAWLLDHELKKLRAYCGTRKIISRHEVEAITTYTPQAKMYQLTESITKGDTEHALKTFHELTAHEEPTLGILNYINRFILGIIEVQSAFKKLSSAKEVSRVIRKPEYVVRKNLDTASKLTDSTVQKAMELLLQADYGMKKGKDKRLIYEVLLIHLCALFK